MHISKQPLLGDVPVIPPDKIMREGVEHWGGEQRRSFERFMSRTGKVVHHGNEPALREKEKEYLTFIPND